MSSSFTYTLTVVLSLLGVSLSQWADPSNVAGFDLYCRTATNQCPDDDITFWLYTRETKDKPFEINTGNFSDAPYAKNASVVVIIHGYTESKDTTPNTEIRSALLARGEYNIISVDYSPLAKKPCYLQAVISAKPIANCTAQILLQMIRSLPQIINLDNLHIIGFSLGAHIAGILGYYFQTQGNVTLKWITGLDPAMPLFEPGLVPADSRLTKDDADFVDVLHTNGGEKGTVLRVGTVDFYFNNGRYQPGCDFNGTCSHLRAPKYYAESINKSSPGFWAEPCTLHPLMPELCPAPKAPLLQIQAGFDISNLTQGTYQIITNSESPFAKGKIPT